jgi:hypothetical protein
MQNSIGIVRLISQQIDRLKRRSHKKLGASALDLTLHSLPAICRKRRCQSPAVCIISTGFCPATIKACVQNHRGLFGELPLSLAASPVDQYVMLIEDAFDSDQTKGIVFKTHRHLRIRAHRTDESPEKSPIHRRLGYLTTHRFT